MNWFTIFVDGPKRELHYPAKPNCAGQMIVADGPMKKDEAIHIATLASDSWKRVSLFKGKMFGKLILELP